MINTIFYLSIILWQACIAWVYSAQRFSCKSSGWRLTFSFVIACFLLFLSLPLEDLLLNKILFLLIHYFFLRTNYLVSSWESLRHAAFFTCALTGSELLTCWLFNGFQLSQFPLLYLRDPADFIWSATILVCSNLVYGILCHICTHAARIEAQNAHDSESALLFFPSVSLFIAATCIYLGKSFGTNGPIRFMMLLLLFTLLAVNLLFLFVYQKIQNLYAQQLELQLSLQQEQANLAYYQALQQQFDSQRILIHDIKNHLQSIHGLAQQENAPQVKEYLENLMADMAQIRQARLCSDPILNQILLRTKAQCKAKNIVFQCDVREDCLASMDAPSITTLYENLLSNAREAAEQSANPLIELSVTKRIEQQQIVISIINSCDTPPIPDGVGGFISHKKDKLVHGLGLKSIQRIVTKYHGTSVTYYDPQEKQFHHILRFPL